MIYLYSGTPGSGKSLHVARVIYFSLKRKLPVIANFEINLEKVSKNIVPFYYCPNDKLTPQELIDYSMRYWNGKPVREGKLLVVIDECQLMFNSRDWNAKGRNEWLSFFTQHRKYGYDIILIAQFDRMIDRQIRALIEYEQIHRKVSNFGIKGKIFSLCAGGNLFISVKVWYPMKEKVGSEFFKASRRYYSLYDSYQMFSLADEGGAQGPPPDSASAEQADNMQTA